jgi:hypothetical protein
LTDELITQFSSTSFSEWCREKFDRFTADPHAVPDTGDFDHAEIVGYVQTLRHEEENKPLLVMTVHVGEQINERSSRRKQFDFARKQLQAAIDKPPSKVKGLFTQGLFAFYDNSGAFRLSLVSGRAEGKKLVYSDFRRQSFFVKPDRNNKTFRARMGLPFGTYQELANAFSVETLTKEFYNSLFAWYERAMDPKSKVSFPNDLARDDDDRNLLPEHLIRLITRLMFVWFLRQKDLVPETLFDGSELEKLLKDFDPESRTQDNYYRAILQNLFFATLNCEIKDRAFAVERGGEDNKEHYGIKVLYRYRDEFACTPEIVLKLFRQVPFLNGGLFECLDKKRNDSPRSPILYHDGFSREPKKRAHIPNNLLLDDEGLIALFDRYDFTVDENSPNDSDVALDPELLGKVFENLLGAYNPETQETARKQSGSFYTPREIVNYMVDESLVAHLRSKVPEAEESVIRRLLCDDTPPEVPDALRRTLVAALYHCRIIDPACGSGAFPMGLLLKMVHLLQRLDQMNTLWHQVVLGDTEKALAEAESLSVAEKRQRRQRITDSFNEDVNHPDYARKLYLIENCIFGVDIQPIAVQIAKLRAFITLVCDQEPDKNNIAGNYGMLPLPNLETKFVAANSLIGLSCDFADGLRTAEGDTRLDDPVLVHLRSELAEIRHQHFRARNAHDKNICRKQDLELRGKIKARLVEIASKPDAAKIARFQEELELLQLRRKAVEHEDWRDVVHTKPIQPDMFQSTPASIATVMRIDVNKEQRSRLDVEIRFVTRAIESEQERTKNRSAFQKEADRLAAWDPYDQNTSSPFFDRGWMFGFKGGFDVVIGNPPYVRPHKIDSSLKQYLWKHLKTFVAKSDLYSCFMERGLDFLRENGLATFIVPHTWTSLESFTGVRQLYATKTHVLRLVQLPKKVFHDSTVETCIFLVQKNAAPSDDHEILVECLDDKGGRTFVRHFRQSEIARQHLHNFQLYALETTSSLTDKLKAKAQRLETLVDFVYGFKTGDDDKFLSSEQKNKDCKACIRSAAIHRYYYDPPTEFVWYIPEKMIANRKTARPGERQRFEAEKIVVSRMGRQLIATYDAGGLYVKDAMLLLKKQEANVDLRYLIGLLNSRLLGYYYREYFITIDVLKNALLALPIIPMAQKDAAPRGLQDQIVVLVQKILTQKTKNSTTDTNVLEREIDQKVYALYGLTPEEIAVVERRDASAKGSTAAEKPVKSSATKKRPRKSVMTDDPDLS